MNPRKIPVPLRALEIPENVSDAVYAFDRDWRFVYANDPALAMARLPVEQMLGGVFWSLFPELLGTEQEAVMIDGLHRRFEYFMFRMTFGSKSTRGQRPTRHQQAEESRLRKRRAYQALKMEQERLRVSDGRFRITLQNSPVAVFNQNTNLEYIPGCRTRSTSSPRSGGDGGERLPGARHAY